MKDLFPDFSADPITKPVLMIAITARTGSTWLREQLEAFCPLGRVMEIFNPRGPIQHSGCWSQGVSFREYMRRLADRPYPVLAFKVAWHDFKHIAPFAGTLFPDLRIAYLCRRNIEAQALSLYLAKSTGRWHSHNPGSSRPKSLNMAAIDRAISQIQADIHGWQSFFREPPLTLYYEDFRNDPFSAVKALAVLAGLPVSLAVKPSKFQKLGDDNDPWLEEIAQHRSRK